MDNLDDGVSATDTSALIALPEKYEYTLEDFFSEKPYQEIYKYVSAPFVFESAVAKMEVNAREVGFKRFKTMLKTFAKAEAEYRCNSMLSNMTEFCGPYQQLDCGQWDATDAGIYRVNAKGNRECACAHPIMPVERLVNIDTGEIQLKLAYRCPGKGQPWRTIVVGRDVIATARSIVQLATSGISVTSNTAPALVQYLNEVENRNYDAIPEQKSIGRMGYIEGIGFSPYVDKLVFDGDSCFCNLYNCVKQRGSFNAWKLVAKECRSQSVTAKIMLAASFASPLLSIVGSLPFFVHLWGVDAGTGKTVALMLAASVWGNPAVGSYVQTFNATQVGQERTAAFLNHLPLCLDELQLTKNGRGQSNFDVYQLAQGAGRSRGKKQGGVEITPTWHCTILTTGESPITNGSSGAGAINRVVDIECTAGAAVIKDGHRVAEILRNNYGSAGEEFIKKLYKPEGLDERLEDIRRIYEENLQELRGSGTTDKQAMAAAAILTADFLAGALVFDDEAEDFRDTLLAKDIVEFLASKEVASAGQRAYDWLCDWVISNVNHFNTDMQVAQGELFGELDDGMAYIIRSVFDRVVQDAGFSSAATLSYLKSNRLIEVREKGYTKTKRIRQLTPQCVWLRLPRD